MKRLWTKRQLPSEMYGFTPGLEFVRFKDLITEDYSESVYPYGTKGIEIGEWLRINKPNNPFQFKYAIIDDEDDYPQIIRIMLYLPIPLMA